MSDFNASQEQVRKLKIIDLVCSQTDYSKEEAEKKLEERNYNYLDVIKEYLNPNIKPVQQTSTLNQQIFQNIRGFMDNSSKELLRRQEYYKKARQMSFEKNKNNMISEEEKSEITNIKVDGNKKNIINI